MWRSSAWAAIKSIGGVVLYGLLDLYAMLRFSWYRCRFNRIHQMVTVLAPIWIVSHRAYTVYYPKRFSCFRTTRPRPQRTDGWIVFARKQHCVAESNVPCPRVIRAHCPCSRPVITARVHPPTNCAGVHPHNTSFIGPTCVPIRSNRRLDRFSHFSTPLGKMLSGMPGHVLFLEMSFSLKIAPLHRGSGSPI